jgi:molybdenum cofactor synthesis domain-containing protein
MEQHIKIRMAVHLLKTYVSISLTVALLIFLGLFFLFSQSAECLSAESRGTQIESAVTRQNPPLSAVADSKGGQFVNPRPAQPTRYMIVVTGGELLSGVYPDGHTYFITRSLHPLGLQCVGSMSVDDKQADLKEALRYATDKAALVIVTGGLGPTDSDITRETLSDFTGIALKEHPDVLRDMARRFRVSPAQLRPNLRRQTQVPTRGTYFKNLNGTAVGLVDTAVCRPWTVSD